MEQSGARRIDTPRVCVSSRASKYVNVVDESKVPREYISENVTESVDKMAVAAGSPIPGQRGVPWLHAAFNTGIALLLLTFMLQSHALAPFAALLLGGSVAAFAALALAALWRGSGERVVRDGIGMAMLALSATVALGGDYRVHNPIEMAIVVVDIQNGGINQKRHVVGNDFNHHIAGRKSRFGVLLQAAQTRLAALSRLASKVIMAQRACQKLRQGIMV